MKRLLALTWAAYAALALRQLQAEGRLDAHLEAYMRQCDDDLAAAGLRLGEWQRSLVREINKALSEAR